MDAVSRISGVFYLLMERAYYKEEALFNYNEVIESGGKFFLGEIIPEAWYERWFSKPKKGKGKIFILNKGRCGNGGTTGFINYARKNCKGLLVSVPNRSIVLSKETESKDLCCVYGGAENIEKERNIRVCTWDKTESVEGFANCGVEVIDIDKFFESDSSSRIWAGSLLVIDEYHKLVDDSNYRDICYDMVERIMTTDSNVVLMSATLNHEFIDFLAMFSGKEVETYNVQYDDEGDDKKFASLQWMDRGKGIRTYDIVCEIINTARKKKKEYAMYPSKIGLKNNQVVFFYNSVKEITNIVKAMPDKSDVEVLCAKDELHELTVPCYSEQFNEEKLIHFATSANFTGMDIILSNKGIVNKIVIIGGNSQDFLAYSNKNIKQMLGRPRMIKLKDGQIVSGYENSFVIPNGRAVSKFKYANAVAKRNKAEKKVKKYQKRAGDEEYVRDFIVEIIQWNLDYMYYSNIVESMEGWKDGESFQKMMSVYPEYTVTIKKMPIPKHYKRMRDITFDKYKAKRLKGEKVEYTHAAMCELFIERFGLDAFSKAGRNEIERKVLLDFAVKDVDIESMTREQKFVFLLGDGKYTGSYLMDVLDYLGEAPRNAENEKDYTVLEEKMYEVFGCFCIYQSGRVRDGGAEYLCLLTGEMVERWENREHGFIYKDVFPLHPLHHHIKVSKKISKPNKATVAITEYLDSTKLYSIISDGDEIQKKIFTEIFKDVSVIPSLVRVAERKKYLDKVKMNQTMISEFYKDAPSSTRYAHKTEEMEKIDCLIVDIDDSISYYEFKDKYSHLTWTAYPTTSNYDADNWRKFRVIIPLTQTLLIPNDSLNVLKLLRRMICKYEDKNHQLPSFINQEQWDMRRSNEGELVDISQDTVTYLDSLLQNLTTVLGKFRKSKKDDVVVDISEVTDAAIERAVKMITEAKEGNRHATIYGQMWKLMTIYRISDEQIDYIREQITDYEKVKEFNEQVKYIYKRYMR